MEGVPMPAEHDRRVLIAEQNLSTHTFLVKNLVADGYWPVYITDSADPVHVAVISDAHPILGLLCGNDGRKHHCQQLAILVLQSQVDEHRRLRLLERGADDVLSKPFSYPELRARLEMLLGRTR